MSYITERRQEEKERRRAEILDATEAVATAVGWEELTMDQVARKARLSRALLYVYFKDKVDLMFAVSERGLSMLKQRFDEAVARNKTGLEQMVALGRAYIAYSQEFPVYWDVQQRCEFISPDIADMQPNEEACHRVANALRALMVDVLETGVRDGSIRPDVGNLPAVASVLWGFVQGVIQLSARKAEVFARDGLDSRQLLDQAMVMATRSLAVPT